jgi:hypothetical protein
MRIDAREMGGLSLAKALALCELEFDSAATSQN